MRRPAPITLPDTGNTSPLFSTAQILNVQDEDFQSIKRARVRIFIFVAIFALALFLIITRLAEVSLLRIPSALPGIPVNDIRHRADIVDRNGELLATSLETYSLYADARKVWEPVASTHAITTALPHLDAAIIEEKLSSEKAFVWISRNLTPRERQAVFALGLPELAFQIERKRVYPRGNLAAHVLGFTDIDLKGVAGAERAFEMDLSRSDIETVALSIDLRVQHALDAELRKGVEKFQADAASGVVLNIKTGELLGLISLPDFDPNISREASPQSRLNRASMSVYELGSTFKPITMALARETGVIREGEKLPVQNPLIMQNKLIRDDHPSPVPLGIRDILAESSNRGSAIIALRAGADAQKDLLRRIGLFDRVPFELAESAAPILPGEWQNITTATVSYGHGISVTPLALATAIASLLNDGVYVAPTLRPVEAGKQAPGRQVVAKEVSDELTGMMRYVVTNGTGSNARVPGYRMIGKTGTADKLVGGEYAPNRVVTSFVGAFPHPDPEYLVYIVYDEPKPAEDTYGFATAGWNAARTVGAVVERIAPMLGVKRITQTSKNTHGRWARGSR